jgi:hypothetical protein
MNIRKYPLALEPVDIMERFGGVHDTCELFERLTDLIAYANKQPDRSVFLPDDMKLAVADIYQRAKLVAMNAWLRQTLKLIIRVEKRDRRHEITFERLAYELEGLSELFKSEIAERVFLVLDAEDAQCYDRQALFGRAVYDAFPSARHDIADAGNCFATSNATACVFHLMRAAEIGLRTLAKDRRVTFTNRPNVPLEYRQWDDILRQLEQKERDIEQFPVGRARDVQLAFYHGALIQLRAFKNKFRNPASHSRESYDINQARSAMEHVREFMQILAERISEKTKTPEKWTDLWLRKQNAAKIAKP